MTGVGPSRACQHTTEHTDVYITALSGLSAVSWVCITAQQLALPSPASSAFLGTILPPRLLPTVLQFFYLSFFWAVCVCGAYTYACLWVCVCVLVYV